MPEKPSFLLPYIEFCPWEFRIWQGGKTDPLFFGDCNRIRVDDFAIEVDMGRTTHTLPLDEHPYFIELQPELPFEDKPLLPNQCPNSTPPGFHKPPTHLCPN